MRIIVFILTAILELAAGVFGFFVLLLGLNGYSERQATPGLIFYIVFCLAGSLSISFLGTIAAKTVVKKGWLGKPGAAIISIVFTSIIGVLLVIVALFLGFIIAEFLRRTR